MPTPQHKYGRDFLTLVVLRVDFPSSPLTLTSEPSDLTRAIQERFPHTTTTPLRDVTVNMTETGADVKESENGTQWVHRPAVDSTKGIALRPTFLSLEFGPADYQGFTDFRDLVEFLLNALQKAGVKEFSRIGLRYVNEIRLPGRALDWAGVIDEKILTAVLARPMANGRMQRSMHQICEIHDDDQLVLNYGLVNPDFPAPLVQRHFVLDIDCVRQGSVLLAEAIERVQALNDLATSAFESCIGEKLRLEMEKKND
jgi:uncharacterized protein (TIGR04255 family)